jgi:hypothetical protein
MHGHEPALAVPTWIEVLPLLLVVYLIIALLAGCPYCYYPDLKWPVTLARGLI